MRSIFIFMLLFWVGNSFAELPPFIKEQHRASLSNYLNINPHFKTAPESLCDCTDDISKLRKHEPLFQPYYAVGDINDDGIEDFAIGLLETAKANEVQPKLTVVIFHGPFQKQKAKNGIEVIKDYSITRPLEVLYVFKTRVEHGYRYPARLDLGAGPFGSDDNWMILYNWKAKKYVVKYGLE